MFQLPVLGAGATGLVSGSGTGQSGETTGLANLFSGAETELAGFSAEVQALLMQMTPQLLQRLEEMLSGGMSLPQAAKSLLAEAGGGMDFAEMLKGMDLVAEGEMSFDALVKKGSLPQLAGNLLNNGTLQTNLAAIGNLDPQATPLGALVAAAQQVAPNTQFSSQLASSLLEMGVPQTVGSRGWDSAIVDRLAWMVQGEQQFAKLKLNPPNLGPLEVRLSVNQDQASVTFLAPHAAVREALEAAMPRLREMFDQQSLQLVRADVGDPNAHKDSRAHDSSSGGGGLLGDANGDDIDADQASTELPKLVNVASSLIDLFA